MEKELFQRIQDLFENESTGHDFYHLERVFRNAQKIAKVEGGDTDRIELLAFLHEVGDYKLNDGEDKLPQMLHDLLKDFYSKQFINELILDINSVSYRGGFNVKSDKLEVQIVQDADRLDALGAIGIARCFAYGGKKQRPIYDPKIPVADFKNKEEYKNHASPSLNHFYEKLFKLKDLLNTNTGKAMAQERHDYMQNFVEQFLKEWHGNQAN